MDNEPIEKININLNADDEPIEKINLNVDDDSSQQYDANQEDAIVTSADPNLIVGSEGLALRYVIMPQILNAVGFLCSLHSSMSCHYVIANYNYSLETAELNLKSKIGIGMLSKETADLNSDQCYWYSAEYLRNDVYDWSFRLSVFANTIGTLIGGLNVIYSLFLWCRVIKGNSLQFLCGITMLSILCGIFSLLILASSVCRYEGCDVYTDGLDSTCVNTHCTLGSGSYFSISAVLLWFFTLLLFISIRQRIAKHDVNQWKQHTRNHTSCTVDVENGEEDEGEKKTSTEETGKELSNDRER